jgi:hypothetical protein
MTEILGINTEIPVKVITDPKSVIELDPEAVMRFQNRYLNSRQRRKRSKFTIKRMAIPPKGSTNPEDIVTKSKTIKYPFQLVDDVTGITELLYMPKILSPEYIDLLTEATIKFFKRVPPPNTKEDSSSRTGNRKHKIHHVGAWARSMRRVQDIAITRNIGTQDFLTEIAPVGNVTNS